MTNYPIIRKDINPDNCKEKGYEWRHETSFDPEAPNEVNADIVSLAKDGYILGQPATDQIPHPNNIYGLYRKIKAEDK